ncbi:MAG: hypothetical protein DCC75_05965 [Proteobacteria bacterium]|nr:MAG: hypothetical protein DCC75_05965 [Pseudomonadota bacterium]
MAAISSRPALSPVPERFVFDGASLPSVGRTPLYVQTGKLDPLNHFPVAILSKAIQTAREIATEPEYQNLRLVEPSAEIRALAVIGAILSLNRIYWGEHHGEEVALFTLSGQDKQVILRCPNGLVLGLNEASLYDDSKPTEFFLDDPEQRLSLRLDGQVRKGIFPFFDRLLQMASDAVDRRLIHGAPSLVFPDHGEGDCLHYRTAAMKILAVIRNSPYNPDLTTGGEAKLRFRIIGAINAPESEEGLAIVSDTIRRRPGLLKMPGWCEGTPFHKAAQLGKDRLLNLMLEMAMNTEAQVAINMPIEGLLSVQDADGSTPYHLAVRYGKGSSAQLIESAGGAKSISNHYGYIIKS